MGPKDVFIKDVRVFDGQNVRERWSVLVEDGRISHQCGHRAARDTISSVGAWSKKMCTRPA